MVNIKYFVDGEKVLENEYNNTAFTNFNDLIKKNLLDSNFIYKFSIIRCKNSDGDRFQTEYYMMATANWAVYNTNGYKHRYDNFDSTANISSKWKIYFNKTDAKYLKIEDVVIDHLGKESVKIYSHFVNKHTNLAELENYRDYMTDISNLELNNNSVNYLKFNDLQTCNVLKRKVKITKNLNTSYCIIFFV
jgi:hypothetical protein